MRNEVINNFLQNQYLRPQIIGDLEKGINLIIDRYAFSGVAYTSAKVNLGTLKLE